MKHAGLFCAVLFFACKPTSSTPTKPMGELWVEGRISELRLLPGEQHIRFLVDAQSPQAKETASSLRLGKLHLYALQTRKLTQIGERVASLADAYQATSDGKYLLFLEEFDVKTKRGHLHCAQIASGAVGNALGREVSFFVVSPEGQQVAFVDGGVLKTGPLPLGPFEAIGENIADAEFSKDGSTLAFKQRFEAGAQLWVAAQGEKPRRIAENTGDYRLSKDGKRLSYSARKAPGERAFELFSVDTRGGEAKRLSEEMFRFALSPDERWVAYIEAKNPTEPGTLWVRPAAGEGEAKKLGEKVREFEYASTSEALAWRESVYGDEGILAVAMLQGSAEPKRLTPRTRHWKWSPQGDALGYTAAVSSEEAGVSVDLFTFRLGDKAPTKLHTWVYEYAFSTDGKSILFEAECTREGRSCALLSAKLAEGEGAKKEKLADGVYSFRQSADGAHVYWLHITSSAPVHTQLWVTRMAAPGAPQKLAEHIHAPPPLAVDATGTKFLYISNHLRHEGLYYTELP